MPEGDTLYRTAATLHRALAGKAVVRFESVYPALTRIDEDAPIAGRVVERVRSVGKHLLVHFSGGLVLRSHLRMNGSWHVYRRGERWQRPARDMRILIETHDFAAVGFRVPDAEFLDADRPGTHDALRGLGSDLLASDFDLDAAVARVRTQGERTVDEVLLDQRVLAGIGNVYKSEILFACRVFPFAPVATLDESTVRRLVETARTMMRVNVAPESGAVIVTYAGLRRTTGRSDPGERLWVYGRRGRPCRRCGTAIASRKTGMNARLTYWCPRCQASGGAGPG